MGWVTPLGHDVDSVWKRLLHSESGMGPITRFDARTFPTTFAAEVKNYDIAGFVKDPSVHATAGLNSQFALGAACQAWKQSGLGEYAALDRKRVGLYLGAGEGVIDFANYAASNLAGWDADAKRIDGVKWANFAHKAMDRMREVEQEPNMPLAHLARQRHRRPRERPVVLDHRQHQDARRRAAQLERSLAAGDGPHIACAHAASSAKRRAWG